MIIKSDGKIGIGTNNPVEDLDIKGDLKVSGTIIGNKLDNNYYWIFKKTDEIEVNDVVEVDSFLALRHVVGYQID